MFRTHSECIRNFYTLLTLMSFSYTIKSDGHRFLWYIIIDSYNLPFVLSFSVLDQVLEILMVEGNFNCSKNHRHGLDCRMKSSKGKLEWKNFCLALIGKEHRNCLAHEGILLNKKECLKYINTIEEELNNWKIIDH